MPQISKRKLHPKVEAELLSSLEYVFTHSTVQELSAILSSLMIKTELLMIAKRLGVAELLQEGLPDTHIDQSLKVTRSTVNKIALMTQTKSEGFDKALQKVQQRRVNQKLKNVLLEFAKYAIPAAAGHISIRKP